MQSAKTKTFLRVLLANMLLITTLSSVLIGCLWVVQETLRFKEDMVVMRERMIGARKEKMKEVVDGAVSYLQFMQGQADARTRSVIKERVYEAHGIATHLYAQYQAAKTPAELEDMIREALRPIRFNDGRGYFFATRLDGLEQLCATCSHLEQQNLLDLQDTQGAYVIQDMAALVRQAGEGYYSYTWSKPDSSDQGHVKISFVKLFEPFQWFIGAGEYSEDIEEDLKLEALHWIRDIRYEKVGYVFVGQWDGTSLSGPAVGTNTYEVTDPNGVKIVQEMIRLSQGDGGFVDYTMPGFSGHRPAPKISYVKGLPAWQWYVGTGLYLDDIEKEIADYRHRSLQILGRNIVTICVLVLLLWLVAYALVARLNAKAQTALTAFSHFFNRSALDQTEMRTDDLAIEEFRELACSANRMIAKRREAEESRRQSEETFRNIVQASPMGIHLYQLQDDDCLVFIGANPAADKLLGVDNAQFVGKPIEEAFPPLAQTDIPSRYRRAARHGESWHTEHINYEHGKIAGAFEVYVFQMAPGKAAVLFSEITARKRSEEEKDNLQSQLTQAQKMESVGRLAGGVAHDFNNMLSVILGHAELVLHRLDVTHPHYASLQNIHKAAERSADLTRQLLAFARKQTVAPQVLDLNATMDGMLSMLRRLIGEDVDLAWLPGSNLGTVKIDPSQIDQILVNLCVNARDAIGDTGKITIETNAVKFDEAYCAVHADVVPGDYVQLAVSDNGCGMSPETVSHLFEPFFTTKATGKGTGLGLATVYGIVKQNNGLINVYSEPGQGTTFKVYLPRYATRTERMATVEAAEPIGRGHETILLVEDEAMILDMTKDMLLGLGYTVLPAMSPGEAIRLAREHVGRIHLLMTDVIMPEMNGRDLAKNLLSLFPDLKRLFMSGYTANVIAHHGVLDHGVHFLQKPFTMQVLAAKIREVLDQASN